MWKIIHLMLLSGLGGFLFTHNALAIPPGCADQKPTFDERHKFGGEYYSDPRKKIWGISGQIEIGALDICPEYDDADGFSIPNATWVWVGLDNNVLTGFGSFIQLGYVRRTGIAEATPTTHVYVEARTSPTVTGGQNPFNYYFTYLQGSPPPGGVNTYKVDLDWQGTNAKSFWRYYLNGTQIFHTNSGNPGSPTFPLAYNSIPFQPTVAKALVEVANPANQLPGIRTNPVTFSNISVKYGKTGNYSQLSLRRRLPDFAISAHARSDMTDPDTTWSMWDLRY